jgi:hypothetical protein
MTPERFCYWLQGFAELNAPIPPTIEQWQSIREHLATVFDKVTPVMPVLPDVVPLSPAMEALEKARRDRDARVVPGRPPLSMQDIIKSLPNQMRPNETRITC